MQKIKLCVLRDKGIQTVLLIDQRKTVPVCQHRDVAVQAMWKAGGWSFHVTQSASPLYQLCEREIEPSLHCVITLEGQRIHFYTERLCANALCFHGYTLTGIMHIGRSSTQESCPKSAGISLCHALLRAEDTKWELVDQVSTNGYYVNGDRTTRHTVVSGDVIYPGNVVPLMGKDSIFIPEQITGARLSKISHCKAAIEEGEADTAMCSTPGPMRKLTVEIELPLAKGTQENLPAIFVLGPSITMGFSSTVMRLFSLQPAIE